MEQDIHEQAASLRELKLARDEAKAQYRSLDDQFKNDQTKLMERMEDAGVDGIKKDGINFVPVTTIYGQIQDRAEFIRWAEDENPELLERKERSELINELARQCLDDGEEFPPGLGFRTRPYISQRSA
jgi:hypothetical protein